MSPEKIMAALAAEGVTARLSPNKRIVYWDRHQYDADTGKVTAVTSRYAEADGSEIVGQLKQRYSKQIVREQARRFGWQLRETGPNKFVVVKR
jgi:hypothetical protein